MILSLFAACTCNFCLTQKTKKGGKKNSPKLKALRVRALADSTQRKENGLGCYLYSCLNHLLFW